MKEEIDWRVIDSQILDMKSELIRASKKNGGFHSEHEAYAVIKEELEELWEAIKAHKLAWTKRNEAIQLGAMVLRYINDFCNLLGPGLDSVVPENTEEVTKK